MVKKKRYPFWFEEPFDEFRRMQEEFFRNMQEMFRRSWSAFRIPEFRTKFIPVRIGETNKELIIRAELPGFSKDEIKLKVDPESVYISAERKKQAVEKDKTFYRMERVYNSASRVISLPKEVKTEGAKAKFKNGVLEIVLKKKKPVKEEKEIKIE